MQIPQTMTVTPAWAAGQDAARWLTPAERARCGASPSPRRAADRTAGRLAVKRLLWETFGVPPLAYEVAAGDPAPSLTDWPGPAGLTVSLSHSDGLGAASWSWAAEEGAVGVDAQRIRPARAGLAERALTPAERAQAALVLGGDGLLLFWALKEAAIKARRRAWGRALTGAVVTLAGADGRGGTARVAVAGEGEMAARYARQDGWWVARAVTGLARPG